MNTDTESMIFPKWMLEGRDEGWIRRYDLELIKFVQKEYGELEPGPMYAILALSLFVHHGHTCLPLNLSISEWFAHLDIDAELHGVGEKIDENDLLAYPAFGYQREKTPFLIADEALFFRKIYKKELIVAQKFKELSETKFEEFVIPDGLNFEGTGETDWQQVALLMAIRNRLLVISGGPGTGKTTTVARIIRHLMTIEKKPLRIALAAPTGKAAARMNASLAEQLSGQPESSTVEQNNGTGQPAPPLKAKTLHRLLWKIDKKGMLPPPFEEKLPYDLVIVDEASMIDLGMMEKLLRYTGRDTRLILLGDKDQLSSVEEGTVLGDICRKQQNLFTDKTVHFLRRSGVETDLPAGDLTALQDSILYLTKNYRFGTGSGIYSLANAVKEQDPEKASKLIGNQLIHDVQLESFQYLREELNRLSERLASNIEAVKEMQGDDLLAFWQREAWLTVLRRGAAGSESLNRFIENSLLNRGVVRMDGHWYHGRPVLITRNDYSLGLFNGDFGVCEQTDAGGYSILFESAGGEIKTVPARRLGEFDPGYFLTVHKSQGSEFETVNLLLPLQDTPLLSRELIYTAITRARKKFTVWGDLQLLLKGIDRKTERFTGLKRRIDDQ